jgi:hypothetical protein
MGALSEAVYETGGFRLDLRQGTLDSVKRNNGIKVLIVCAD